MKKILKTLKEKWAEYILEILVIIIGIIAAFMLNSWHEDRKDHKEETIILTNLMEDLKDDVEGFNESLKWLSFRKAHVDSILWIIENPKIPVNHPKLVHWLITSGYILDYTPVFPTYSEIVGSGKLSLIQSMEIKKALAEYQSDFINDLRIFSSYDEGIKKIELKAMSYIDGRPIGQFFYDDFDSLNSQLSIDLISLRKDKELIGLLKHNAYHTQVEMNMKLLDYIPAADALIQNIQQEIDSRK